MNKGTRPYVSLGAALAIGATACGGEPDAGKVALAGNAQLPATVDYNYHVRPILSDKCFKCHGPDPKVRESGLRLDTEEGAFKPLIVKAGGFAFVAGDPGASEVYRRITSRDSAVQMPP